VEESEIEVQMVSCITKSNRQKYRTATANVEEMQVLMQFSESGFPASIEEFPAIRQAVFQLQGTNCYDGVLFNGKKLMISKSLGGEVVCKFIKDI
jgi:hypothetical protein